MKIKAPGLTTTMAIETLDVEENQIIVRGRIGAYSATATAGPGELRLILSRALKPRILLHLVRLLFQRSPG